MVGFLPIVSVHVVVDGIVWVVGCLLVIPCVCIFYIRKTDSKKQHPRRCIPQERIAHEKKEKNPQWLSLCTIVSSVTFFPWLSPFFILL
jgi:hypothetical protein